VILGTAAYMPPEQARGKTVDKRADIWSFGVVLYELLTGEPLFTGEDAAETLAAVIHKQPDFPRAPAKAQRLLRRCLEKDPKKRLRDIGEAQYLLEEEKPPIEPAAATAPSRSRLGWAPWVVAGLLLTTTFGVSFVHFREAVPAERTARFQALLPEKAGQAIFKVSPDGRSIAITARESGRRKLWIRPIDSLELRELPGTEDASYPFWSPDSAYVGFFAQGKLKKIAVSGGPPQTLCDASNGRGGTWNREGIIVFSPGPGTALLRVSANGGVPAPATKLVAPMDLHRFPEFLPDGKHFLYTINSDKAETSGIYVGALDEVAPVRLMADPSNAEYVPPVASGQSGHLLFRREATLMAEPFDPAKLSGTGELFPVAEQVATAVNNNNAAFSASLNGLLAYFATSQEGNRELVWMDHGGKRIATVGQAGRLESGALSPDDSRISFSRRTQGGLADLWLMDVARGVPSRFTFGPGISSDPVWSPDGGRIVFMSLGDASTPDFWLYQKPSSGAGKGEPMVRGGNIGARPQDWSGDGKWIVYEQTDAKTKFDLWLLPLGGDRKPVPYLRTPFNETGAQFSPDGKWMAYVSDESGQPQVYVQPIPASGAKWQVSSAGGSQPRWRRDGKELFYISAEEKLTAVPLKTGSSFEMGPPQELFELQSIYSPIDGRWAYQPTVDGKRFLVTAAVGGATPSLTVELNWYRFDHPQTR
jgi:Tol biopolymer transport system component